MHVYVLYVFKFRVIVTKTYDVYFAINIMFTFDCVTVNAE